MVLKMKKKSMRFLTMVFLLLSTGGISFAQTQNEWETTTFKIALFGPGTPLYSWWGHIGIIIDDGASARIVDYGIFSFEKENFFTNFAFGRMIYSCGSSPAWNVINTYIAQNRDVTLYTLNVSPEKKREIIERIENDLLPENREYLYHHFRDNCATRVRDILNIITGGQLYKRFAGEYSSLTLREHLRRYTYFSPFIDWFLNFLLGRGAGQPATTWDAMFLPAEVALSMQDFEYISEGGNKTKLAGGTETVYTAINRPPVPAVSPDPWVYTLLAGLFMAGVLAFCMTLDMRQTRPAKIAWLLLQGLFGCSLGLAGSLLFFMTFFTNHDYTFNNLNTLIANPLLLAALPLAIMALAADNHIKEAVTVRIIKILWTAVFLGGIASIILSAFSYWQNGFAPQNLTTLALALPASFILSLFPCWMARLGRHFLWRFLP
jgi:hypothetical protein